jgi:hypothetical protein
VPGVWVRTFLITVVVAAASADAVAQSAICEMVTPGDTAAMVSRRLTGRANSHDEPWFRVFDRSRSQVIPRAQYNRLQSGWQACVPAMRAVRHASEPVPRSASTAIRSVPRGSLSAGRWDVLDVAFNRRMLKLALLLLGLAASGAAVLCVWQGVEQAAWKRKVFKREMLAFGCAFLNDFERPLRVDGIADRPVHARMRCDPRQRRLDILLAPGSGRRYPNLADHRRNVEYDVSRIAHHLRHHPFVPSAPHAEGEWVVIPFYFRPGPKTGAVV